MIAVHRYILSVVGEQEVMVPDGAKPLSAAFKPGDEEISVWALVNTDAAYRYRRFRTFATGERADVAGFVYVGTAIHDGRAACTCWHVFMELES